MKQENKKHYECADIERLAQRYIDGQLNEEENKLFEEHLEYCLPCDKKIHFELKLKEIIRIKAREPIPKEKLEQKIKNLLNGFS